MARKTKAQQSTAIVAEICLYGAAHCGYGFLVRTAKGTMAGDGEPKLGRSATDAFWLAQDAVEKMVVAETGKRWGRVSIFAPGGELMSEVAVGEHPYYGQLVWQRATVYSIPAEAIVDAAKVQS